MLQSRTSRRISALVGVVALMAVAAPVAAPVMAQDSSPAASPAAVPVNPYFETGAVAGSGAGKKVGYISLGDSVPFVKLVSDGIAEQAKIAGLDYTFCDSKIDAAEALACAQQFKVQGVQGALNFQVDQASSPNICDAYGNVPTIAIDIVQPPCQVVFMGANNHEAGRLGGAAIGKYVKDTWNCDYTAYVSLESTAAGDANAARMGGYRDGFQEYCPIVNENVLDGADRTDPALQKVSDLLPALPGNRIVVVAINEDGILGAIGAAATLGRSSDLIYSGQGTDPSIWKDVACNPQYIASVAYFPERYGKTLIPAIIDILNGKEITADGANGTVPSNLFTAHQVINASNIRDVYPDTPAC
ncbi:MAG: substrate-binding domain-containing protein [Chloroflexota bacterium]